ncbi:MAG: hypothetical protein IT381_12670 [Deltaproteobacteria bacterium]|nr:hypothetical protein [Deltaproteobacteria bacterium]
MSAVKTRKAKRPDFSAALREILRDVAARVPELKHLQPDRILVTYGQARKKSRATTRPYAFAETSTRKSENGALYKPIVKLQGRRMRYEITLRPLFFLRSSAQDRLRTIFHELYHMSPSFDGTLDVRRRHDALPRSAFDKELKPLIRRYASRMPAWVAEALAFDGEVMVLQWLERPPNRYRPSKTVKRRYTEKDLFLGPAIMVTE